MKYLLLIPFYCASQTLQVDSSYTPEMLVREVLLGECVQISNVTYSGSPLAIGKFTQAGAMGIDSGILMTTGDLNVAKGPNDIKNAYVANGQPGDRDLDNILGDSITFNAASLEFDFVAYSDSVIFTYIFASEEYPEFVCSRYNDIFAFLVSGGIYNNTNVALIPGTSLPVSINSVNNGSAWFLFNPVNCISLSYSALYVDNTGGQVTQFDAYTVPLTATIAVNSCDTYHIKLVIADVNDPLWDSGVFIKSESFSACNCDDNNICTIDSATVVNPPFCRMECSHIDICDDNNPCTIDECR